MELNGVHSIMQILLQNVLQQTIYSKQNVLQQKQELLLDTFK